MKTHQAFHRVQMLHKYNKFTLIAFMESFQRTTQVERYKRRLGMQSGGCNCTGQIWNFVDHNVEVEVIMNIEKQVTLNLLFQNINKHCYTTMIYAKYTAGGKVGSDIYYRWWKWLVVVGGG